MINIKEFYLLVVLILLILSCNLEVIPDQIGGNASKFNTSIGGNGNDFPSDVLAMTDGNFIVAGVTQSFTADMNNDAYLAKVDKDGVIVWEKNYGTATDDNAHSVTTASDGGFVLAGRTTDPINLNYNIFLVKVNSAGGEVWRKTYGASDSTEVVFGIIPTGASDFLVGYTSSALVFSTPQIRFMRINANGSKVSDKLGGTRLVGLNRMIKAADNSIVVTGYSSDGGTSAYVAKFMEAGSMIWDKVFPETGQNYSPSFGLIEMADRSLFIAGSDLGSNDHDFMLVSYSEIGMKIDDTIWGGANADELLAVTKSADDEVVVMGYSGSFSVSHEIYLSKRRKIDGSEIWAKHFGQTWVQGGDVELCPDGGFVLITGQNQANADIIVVKTDANGNYE